MFNKEKKIDIYKLSTLILAVILVATLGFVMINNYNRKQQVKIQDALNVGYNKGVEDSVTKLYQDTNECKVTTLYIKNVTRGLADVECINKVLAKQGIQPQQPTDVQSQQPTDVQT